MRQALQQEQARNAALTAQLQQIQSERTAEVSQLAQYKASLEQTARELAQFGALRDKVTIKRGRLRLQLNEIWRRLSQMRLPLPGPAIAAAGPTAQSGDVASTTFDAAGSGARSLDTATVAAVENVLRSAGVNLGRIVGRIMSQGSPAGAEGGPFVAPPETEGREDRRHQRRKAGGDRGFVQRRCRLQHRWPITSSAAALARGSTRLIIGPPFTPVSTWMRPIHRRSTQPRRVPSFMPAGSAIMARRSKSTTVTAS